MLAFRLLKKIIPTRIKTEIYKTKNLLTYRGSAVLCPCCGGKFSSFKPFGIVVVRDDAQCPKCYSLERHRLLFLYLHRETNIFSSNHKILHFAPEPALSKHFSKFNNLDYMPCDKLGMGYNYDQNTIGIDIENINLTDAKIDIVICSHVLEHVDDKKSMNEIYRILKPGGSAIIQIPIDYNRKSTLEDDNILTAEEREKWYGQEDHLRLYGQDFKNRFPTLSQLINQINYYSYFNVDDTNKYGLKREDIIVLKKPI